MLSPALAPVPFATAAATAVVVLRVTAATAVAATVIRITTLPARLGVRLVVSTLSARIMGLRGRRLLHRLGGRGRRRRGFRANRLGGGSGRRDEVHFLRGGNLDGFLAAADEAGTRGALGGGGLGGVGCFAGILFGFGRD
jgi:hypothetical protein